MKRILFGGAALALIACPAVAAEPIKCGPRDEVAARLLAEFQERPVARGMSSDGFMVEVFASAAGSWTALVTPRTGMSCVASFGNRWTMQQPGQGA